MEASLDQASSQQGTITKTHLGQKTITSSDNPELSLTVDIERYTWQPPAGLDLPEGFDLSFECWTGPDGLRRFVPADSEAMIVKASLLGWSILHGRGAFSRQESFSYHLMRLVYQHAGRRRECFGREFKREADLRITPAAQLDRDDCDVLPDTIGLDANENGTRWSVGRLLGRGREAAIAAGKDDPDEGTCIRLGVLEGARQSPVAVANLSEEELRSLVRIGLFDLGPSADSIDREDLRDRVIDRLLTAVDKHLDDTTDAFNAWFFEGIDNVIHQVAKRKREGGPIERETVRQVFLELVFDAHRYMAESVHVALSMFAEAMDLTDEEFAIYDLLYLKRPELGGLLLVMLRNRFGFAKEILQEMWNDPGNAQLAGTLLRLLHFYGEMTSKRRTADRRYKKISSQRNRDGEVAKTFQLREDDASSATAADVFAEIASRLREQRRAMCDCGATDKWRANLVSDPEEGDVIINEVCPVCGYEDMFTVPRDDFKAIADSVVKKPDGEEVPSVKKAWGTCLEPLSG